MKKICEKNNIKLIEISYLLSKDDIYNLLNSIFMKMKNRLKNLEAARRWWDAQPQSFKSATTRPGSVKQRCITGTNKKK